MEVHQLIPCFTPSDAMGQVAVAWSRLLLRLGHVGELYAAEVAPSLRSLVRPASELRVSPESLVLYHHGVASELAGRLMHLPCRRGVVFHNITPARFYEGTRLAEALTSGRSQLAALAPFVDVSIGVSHYNAAELTVAGHRRVCVVPLHVEPQRFSLDQADPVLLERLRGSGRPVVLSVSRVVAHKRIEDLLALHAELRRLTPTAELLVVGAAAKGNPQFRALEARAAELGGVSFLGRVDHAELVAAYHAADVYVSMSEHEGVGVPLLESFAAGLPVLAFGAAAVPETLGGRGVMFDEKHFAALAEVVMVMHEDRALRQRVIAGQRERLTSVSADVALEALGAALAPLTPVPAPARRRALKRPQVAIVVQRYGEDIVGGAEAHARLIATRLAARAHVEVLTTCATDHLTWANVLPPGPEEDGAVDVRRFPVRQPRRMREFNRLSDRVFGRAQDLVTEAHWLAEQGPLAPGLWSELGRRRAEWDAVIFFTSLYATAVRGVPLLADRALVVPTAHDEPPLAFHTYADVFELPRALLCNTPEEQALIRARFPSAARSRVVGVGVDAPAFDAQRFREKYRLRGPYLLYVGRLEAGKGVNDLLAMHQRLVKTFHDAPELVLAGSGDLVPRGERVVCLGRIDERDKWDALAGALAVTVPSRHESLSLLTLEAFAAGTPVIGNAASAVVLGQLQRSKAGVPYTDEASFIAAVKEVGLKREGLSTRAARYAGRYQWARVMDIYFEEIDRLRAPAKARRKR